MDTKVKKDLGAAVSSVDEELNEILDSALDDFDKTKKEPALPLSTEANDLDSLFQKVWNEDAMLKAMTQFEACMKNLCPENGDNSIEGMDKLCEDFKRMAEMTGQSVLEESSEDATGSSEEIKKMADNLSKDFTKIAEEACRIITTDSPLAKDFQSTISNTLENLKENLSGVDNLNTPDADFLKLLNNFGNSEGTDKDPLGALCNNFLRTFLSKEVLYEPLLEVQSKFPEWLDEKKPDLSPEEFNRHKSQLDVLNKICQEFRKIEESETADEKEDFQKILQLLLELQAYGTLPEDLVSQSVMNINDNQISDFMAGLSSATGSTQCSVM